MNVWPLVSPLNLISSLCIAFELIPHSRIRTHMATLKTDFRLPFSLLAVQFFCAKAELLFARFDSGERGGAN